MQSCTGTAQSNHAGQATIDIDDLPVNEIRRPRRQKDRRTGQFLHADGNWYLYAPVPVNVGVRTGAEGVASA